MHSLQQVRQSSASVTHFSNRINKPGLRESFNTVRKPPRKKDPFLHIVRIEKAPELREELRIAKNELCSHYFERTDIGVEFIENSHPDDKLSITQTISEEISVSKQPRFELDSLSLNDIEICSAQQLSTSTRISNSPLASTTSSTSCADLPSIGSSSSLSLNSVSSIETIPLQINLPPSASTVVGIRIDLSCNNLEDKGVIEAMKQMENDPFILEIDFFRNDITIESCRHLSRSLKTLPNLRSLNMGNNFLDDLCCFVLLPFFRHSILERLELSSNLIHDEGVLQITRAMKGNNTLSMLDLSSNSIGKEGCGHLGEFLAQNSSLTVLNLGSNFLEADGMSLLCEGLVKNRTLCVLNMHKNSIGSKGGISISKVLEKNSSLRDLDLSENNIVTEGCVAIAQSLKKNFSLDRLLLDMNGIGSQGCVALTEALYANKSLRHLSLRRNNIRGPACVSLFKCLSESQSRLEFLNIDNNYIGDECLEKIGHQLVTFCGRSNIRLKSLSINEETFGEKALLNFKDCLQLNDTLTTLVIQFPDTSVAEIYGRDLRSSLAVSLTPKFTRWRTAVSGLTAVLADELGDIIHMIAKLTFTHD